jgi:hypothetical protein
MVNQLTEKFPALLEPNISFQYAQEARSLVLSRTISSTSLKNKEVEVTK